MSNQPSAFAGARGAIIAACDEMARLLDGLNDTHGRVADEIHQTRKAGKKLRGALVMAGQPKPCIRWIAEIGRTLGTSRDAVVRAKTWQTLGTIVAPTDS